MQRQAVPLIEAEAPLVSTGMEEQSPAILALPSWPGVLVSSIRSTPRVSLSVRRKRRRLKYLASTFTTAVQRSNQNTCINQRPLVKVSDNVRAGDIIADGPSTELGELALGRNVLVAFMPWNGYNFEGRF